MAVCNTAACSLYDPELLDSRSGRDGGDPPSLGVDPQDRDASGPIGGPPPLPTTVPQDDGGPGLDDGGGPRLDAGRLVDAGPDAGQPNNAGSDAGRDAGPPCALVDSDSDGTDDCDDECPDDPTRTANDACGCGFPHSSPQAVAACGELRSALVHRYRFDDPSGELARDSVGGANGTIIGASLSGARAVQFQNDNTNAHVQLPTGLLGERGTVTLEAWVTYQSPAAWQRVFDIGLRGPNPPADCQSEVLVPRDDTRFYYFCPVGRSWAGALSACAAPGTHLLHLSNAAERAFIDAQKPSTVQRLWTAGTLLPGSTPTGWYWAMDGDNTAGGRFWVGGIDGSPEPGRYAPWAAQNPSGGSEACAELIAEGLNDRDCPVVQPFVCEAEASGPRPYASVYYALESGVGVNAGFVKPDGTTAEVFTGVRIALGSTVHIALAVTEDNGARSAQVYLDGSIIGTIASPPDISSMPDTHSFLGRSLYAADPFLAGEISEFRVYNTGLGSTALTISAAAGPDPQFLEAP